MAQTVGRPNTANGGGGIGNVWTNPNNAKVDDATNATAASTLNVLGSAQLIGTDFNVLAGESAPFSGLPIPAGASIIGVRYAYDSITGGGAPHVLTHSSSPGASTDPYSATSQAVRTIGYGTLSSGSTVAGGNTYGANNLSTEAGQNAARATLANGTLQLLAQGGVGAVTSNATYGVDYLGVTVEWVLRVDRPGGAKSAAKADDAGSTQFVTAPGGGKSIGKAGTLPKVQVSQLAAGAKALGKAGGAQKPMVTLTGGAKGLSSAVDVGSTQLVTAPGGAKGIAKAGAGLVTVVSFAIAGVARDGNSGTPITTGVRVDVYRTSDHLHMGRVTSDAAGDYAVAIPFTGNELEVFWSRFFQAGAPNRFSTTDEDLVLIEAIVQTA